MQVSWRQMYAQTQSTSRLPTFTLHTPLLSSPITHLQLTYAYEFWRRTICRWSGSDTSKSSYELLSTKETHTRRYCAAILYIFVFSCNIPEKWWRRYGWRVVEKYWESNELLMGLKKGVNESRSRILTKRILVIILSLLACAHESRQ